MQQLLDDMRAAMQKEYMRAYLIHGEKHHSPHEAYSVMLEEYEEAVIELSTVRDELKDYWDSTKANRSAGNHALRIKIFSLNAAAECIQLAAMAHKALQGHGNEEDSV